MRSPTLHHSWLATHSPSSLVSASRSTAVSSSAPSDLHLASTPFIQCHIGRVVDQGISCRSGERGDHQVGPKSVILQARSRTGERCSAASPHFLAGVPTPGLLTITRQARCRTGCHETMCHKNDCARSQSACRATQPRARKARIHQLRSQTRTP